MVIIKPNKDNTLTVTFKNLTKGKFMNLVMALHTLSANEESVLAEETLEAVKRAAIALGLENLVTD